MRKLVVCAVAAATVLLPVGLSGPALAAATAAKPTAVDTTYIQKNAQTDLAEITLGKIVLSRSQSAGARDLASKTTADHQAALAKLQAVAATLDVPLPTAPSPQQQADAATLQNTPDADFDVTYAKLQVLGHQLSIADTNLELASGSDASVKGYASGYLPVAQMHLGMAEALLTSLGGAAPTAVPAGSGGAGAATDAGTRVAQLGIGVLGLLLVGFAASVVLRRRRLS